MIPYINAPFVYIANAIGAAPDELKLVFSFYLSYPLAAVLKRIPDKKPWQKNLFIIGVALFYLVGLFDLWDGCLTLAISAVGAYLITFIDSPYMPWIGFVFLMGHMSVSHIIRMGYDVTRVDVSGAQMVMVMKLTAFCWNVADGRLPESDLSDFQKEHMIKELPSVLDYAGWVLFFPALHAGPAFDYCDYHRYISTTMFTLPPGTDPTKAPPTRKKRKIPRSGTPATFKAFYGTIWIIVFLKLSAVYNVEYLTSDKYMTYSLPRRIFQLYMLGVTARTKYYGVWTLTEGACILSGIGYNGIDPKTGRAKWDRLQNIRPWEVETAQNARAYLGHWNINTNMWLRNYMYLRVTPKGKKPGFRATLATFVTSAFWHGFYPGYYMTFVLASFVQTAAKNGRRLVRPLFLTPDGSAPLPSKKLYDLFTLVLTQIAFGFTVSPFVILTFKGSLLVWARVYFYCILGLICSFALFSRSLPIRRKLQKLQQDRTTTTSAIEKVVKEEAEKDAKADLTKTGTGLSTTSSKHEPILGISDDPEGELDEIVAEVKREIEERRRRGSLTGGFDVRKLVDEKLKGLKDLKKK